MYAVGKIGSYITRGVVSVAAPFHPFGGAVDIVVVEQEDGSFKSSPWYVQFGKFQGVLKAREKVVIINVNGVDAEFGMYLDSKGGAYFLREADGEDGMSEGSWGSSAGGLSSLRRPKKIMSCNYDLERSKLVSEFEAGNGKFVTRSTSNGPRILGFVFGKESENEKASQQQEDVGGRDREGSLESAEIAADLLEVRWSTSLATRKQKKGSSVKGGNKTPKLPHSNGFHDNSSRTNSVNAEGDTEIPLSTAPMTFMESFTLQEKHFEANGVSNSSVRSNVGDAGIIRNGEGAHRSDASRSSNSSSFVEQSEGLKSDAGGFSSGDKNSSALQFVQADDGSKVKIVQSGVDGSKLREITSEIKPGLSSNILACEVANNIGNPFLTNDGSKSIAVTPDDSATLLETKVEVILDCKTDDGPVKYVEEMVVDQVCANQDPSLTTALLIEETTSAALNLMENLKLEKHCSSPHSDVIHPRSCENHDSLVTTGPGSETSEGEQLLSSDLESLERKIAQTTNFSDVDDCGERSDERVGGLTGKLDEAQFVFSDVDGSEAPRTMDTEPTLLLSVEAESNPKKYSGSSEEKLDDEMLKKSRSFTGELIQEVLPNDHPSSPEISRTTSSPVSIARAREQAGQIAPLDLLSSSWSHGVEINSQDVDHPVSRSLDSSFDNMILVQGDVPAISENGTQERQTTPKKSSLEQHQISKELKELLSDPAVEISLSGHLVLQGMGYEAAASAFDAEKVDAKEFISLGSDVMKNDKVVVRIGGLYFPWDEALPIISAIGAPRGEQILEPKGMILVENGVETDLKQSTDSSNGTWKLWRSKKTKTMSRNSSVVSDTGSQRGLAGNADTLKSETMKKNVVRAKTPTSDQLESLNLKEGKNIVTFTFSTPMLGEQKVDAQIYLWKWNARIVISDVDGTITKSDVLGQFMPMVGVDWSQTGVTHLFSAIKENGYELLFLSARAISQASLTRQFLSNLKQDGKALPEGPVVISPDGLFPSLFREVIRRAPHEFKIACLEDIKALFPLDHNPFYAGFGNRDTDEISYVKVGIPIGKVFIINPKGEVAVHRRVDTKSYTVLHDLVNEMFPHPICAPTDEKEDYNTWNFWRLPPPDAL